MSERSQGPEPKRQFETQRGSFDGARKFARRMLEKVRGGDFDRRLIDKTRVIPEAEQHMLDQYGDILSKLDSLKGINEFYDLVGLDADDVELNEKGQRLGPMTDLVLTAYERAYPPHDLSKFPPDEKKDPLYQKMVHDNTAREMFLTTVRPTINRLASEYKRNDRNQPPLDLETLAVDVAAPGFDLDLATPDELAGQVAGSYQEQISQAQSADEIFSLFGHKKPFLGNEMSGLDTSILSFLQRNKVDELFDAMEPDKRLAKLRDVADVLFVQARKKIIDLGNAARS